MELAIQGIKGSYSYQAAILFIKELRKTGINKIKINYFKSFDELLKEFKDLAIVPVENSLIGSIYNNYKRILESNFFILASLNLKIEHALLGNTKDIKEIKTVYSHPIALEQCKDFLQDFS